MEQQDKKPDTRIQNFVDWQKISNSNGWLVFKKKLEAKIEEYKQYMNNLEADERLLKRYQLVKKGLEMALDIPKQLEIKAKIAKNKERKDGT